MTPVRDAFWTTKTPARLFFIPWSSAVAGASFRSRSISLKISFNDAPVTLVVTSAVSTQLACAGCASSVLKGE